MPKCKECGHPHHTHAFFPDAQDPTKLGDPASWCVGDTDLCDGCDGYVPDVQA